MKKLLCLLPIAFVFVLGACSGESEDSSTTTTTNDVTTTATTTVDVTSTSEDDDEATSLTVYFKDASWWNSYAASTNILLTSSEDETLTNGTIGEMMTWIYYDSDAGYNWWSYEIDLTVGYTTIQFIRSGGDNGADDWGARTVTIEISDIPSDLEAPMYDISTSSEAWYGDGNTIEGTWSEYDYVATE